MKKLILDLEHCYGIKKLEAALDFEAHGNVFAIYAPNGVMKTSLANTFLDVSKGRVTTDRIWKDNVTQRVIQDETGADLLPESVFVIEPYNESYRSDRISALLVNDELRMQYDSIHREIDEKATTLTNELKSCTGLATGIKEELSLAITHDPNDFFKALGRVREEVETDSETPLSNVVYCDIFNAKVEPVLRDPKFIQSIKEYIQKYDELVSNSTFFKKGVFTHNNAAEIAKNLSINGFFRADHSVYLRINGTKTEINSLNELESAIQQEKDIILTDESLKSAFEAIDKQLQKNADLRKFRECLEQNQLVLGELSNLARLKQKLWVQYLIRAKNTYGELLTAFNNGKDKIEEIVNKARAERTKWGDVIRIFNERFSVPFVVRMDNQEDVILRSDAPSICFDFLENPDDPTSASARIREDDLKKYLSNGESRALYILNIIFEVEARKAAQQATLFIVDDIADSFDYKNKYAIIEYLSDVSGEDGFRQIILSHNFDFFRTVSSRLNLKRQSRILACKQSGSVIALQPEVYQRASPFAHWRKHLAAEQTMLIASIPFLRNMAEFSGDDATYAKLTSLLHIRPDTDQFTVLDLETLIKSILRDQDNLVLPNPGSLVSNLIYDVALTIANDPVESSALEDKVALSIAIRLKAEEFMIAKINDVPFWNDITKNQTIALIKRFKIEFSAERRSIELFERVNLMTPENIHLNSFMYEPILDLSAHHLKRLFLDVATL